jgi:cytochrome c553
MPHPILSALLPQSRPIAVAFALAALAACSADHGGSGGAEQAQAQGAPGVVHVCSSCHGAGGRSDSPTFPRLAGQQKDYIEAQLKAFRDKTRADPHAHTYMWGMAAQLNDATIEGLASYYSSQQPATGSRADPTLAAHGKAIYDQGIDARNVPACAACHGDKGEGNSVIPRLADQHREYIEEQLRNFASNARANETMHDNAKGLTPDDITALAAYLASL